MTLHSVTGLDHVFVVTHDIDRAQALYRKLGFFLTERGFGRGRGSANHTIPFTGGNYIVLGFMPAEERLVSRFGVHPLGFEGPIAVILQTADSQKVHDELVALGFEAPPTKTLARPVRLPDGTHDARFVNQAFPVVPPTAVLLSSCQHLTPELVLRPEWQAHPNTARAIAFVTVVHPEPPTLKPAYAKLFGESAISIDADGMTVRLGKTRLSMITPGAFAARWPSIAVPRDLSQGWFAGATIAVDSLAAAAAVLRNNDVPFHTMADHGIAVAPEAALSAVLEFSGPN